MIKASIVLSKNLWLELQSLVRRKVLLKIT